MGWSGDGLGVVWEWSGNALGVVWERSGNGTPNPIQELIFGDTSNPIPESNLGVSRL